MNRPKIPLSRFAHKRRNAQQGVVLLEALIAILLFSMGVLALVGLQGAMIKNTSDANYRAAASFIAQQRIGQIWADQLNAVNYIVTDAPILTLPSGKLTVTNPLNTKQYVVTVTWTQPGKPTHKFTTVASIAGG
jgi:type IV pilus assembly protein PilV